MLLKGIIFDLDGVILDSFREGLRRIRNFCAMEEIPFSRENRRLLTEAWGLPGIELLEAGLGINRTLATEINTKWIRLDNEDPPKLVPGSREVLSWARRNGFKSCLLTSRHRDGTLAVLEKHDIAHEFAFICSREDVSHHKPDPRALRPPLEKLHELFNIKKSECCFVGDTPSDIEAGHRARVKTLVVQTGPYFLKHSHKIIGGKKVALKDILSSVDELPLWIEQNHSGELKLLYE